MDQPNQSEIAAAKQFLKNRIVAQAAEKHVSLSDAEIATLTYSEPSASQSEREFADQIDATVGAEAYEEKIAGLIRHAYKSDVEGGRKEDWDRNLRALRYEDLYVLVMVKSAGIPGAPAGLAAAIAGNKAFGIDTLCLGAVGIAGPLVFFTPIGSFLKSDLIRGCTFLFWLAALWGVGTWSRRRTFRTQR